MVQINIFKLHGGAGEITGNLNKFSVARGGMSVFDPNSLKPSSQIPQNPMKLPGCYTQEHEFVRSLIVQGKTDAEIYDACEAQVKAGLGPVDKSEVKEEHAE